MDSITQIVLGAAVGEVVLGRKIGNKAILWGAVAGTIPDLDVLANPWLGVVEELSWHRSLTHSILFSILAAPIFAFLPNKIHRKSGAKYKEWVLLFFLGFITHIFLDCCTTWGTQIFWPFSREGIAFYNIFVIDPFYTIPFLIFLILAATKKKENPLRWKLNTAGLVISTAYLLFTFGAKSYSNDVFEKNLAEKNIEYESYISKPTPLNAFFWAVTVKFEDGYYNGFYSIFDEDKQVDFEYFPKQQELLQPYLPHPKLERLLTITKDYYIVRQQNDGIVIHDLRFGQFNGWQEEGGEFVFSYQVEKENDKLVFSQKDFGYRPEKGYFKEYIDRIAGKEK